MDWLSWKLRRHPNTYPEDEANVSCNSWTEYLLPTVVIAILLPCTIINGITWPEHYEAVVVNTTIKTNGTEYLRAHATYGIGLFLPLVVACIAFRVLCLVHSIIAMIVHLISSAVVIMFVVFCNDTIVAFYDQDRKYRDAIFIIYEYSSVHYMLCKFFFAGFILEFLTGFLLILPKVRRHLALSHKLIGMCVMVLAAFSATSGYQARKFLLFEVNIHQYNSTLTVLEFGIIALMIATYVLVAVDQFRGDIYAQMIPDTFYS